MILRNSSKWNLRKDYKYNIIKKLIHKTTNDSLCAKRSKPITNNKFNQNKKNVLKNIKKLGAA